MSVEVSEDGVIAQKISKSIAYYYIPVAEEQTLCPATELATPAAISLTSSSSPSVVPSTPDSPPSSSSPPPCSPLDLPSQSTPLLSDPPFPSPASLQTTPPSDSPSTTPSPRPLLLLLPWLGARPGAVAKYRHLYQEHGLDVLVVESNVLHFLWPRWGLEYGLEIVKVLEDSRFLGRPILVHAFSIGGYTFTQLLILIALEPEKYASLAQRVVGQIYDSMVAGTLEHMAIGLGKTLVPRLEFLVKNAALLFFWLFKTHTADYYNHGLDVFQNNPITAPALLFFCENDDLCDPVVLESIIDLWSKAGMTVESKKWKESVHAAHMRCHPEEYLSTLETFLNSLAIAPRRAKM